MRGPSPSARRRRPYDWDVTDEQLPTPLAARALERRCAHCHQPIHAAAFDPRWQAYCDVCARRLAGRMRHPESA